jgi:hypothetical protein
MDSEDVHVPDRLVLPAARKQEANNDVAAFGDPAELGVEIVRAEVLVAECVEGLGLEVVTPLTGRSQSGSLAPCRRL